MFTTRAASTRRTNRTKRSRKESGQKAASCHSKDQKGNRTQIYFGHQLACISSVESDVQRKWISFHRHKIRTYDSRVGRSSADSVRLNRISGGWWNWWHVYHAMHTWTVLVPWKAWNWLFSLSWCLIFLSILRWRGLSQKSASLKWSEFGQNILIACPWSVRKRIDRIFLILTKRSIWCQLKFGDACHHIISKILSVKSVRGSFKIIFPRFSSQVQFPGSVPRFSRSSANITF